MWTGKAGEHLSFFVAIEIEEALFALVRGRKKRLYGRRGGGS